MPRSFPVNATHSFEVEVALTGTYQPGYPATGPSYASGGEPAEPDAIEDLDITDIGILERDWSNTAGLLWTVHSILFGVDRKSDAYRQIVDNILAIIGDEATEALFSEAVE